MHTTSTIAWSQNAQLMLVLLLSVLPTVPHLAEAGVEETMPLPPFTNPEITSMPEKEGDDDIDRMLPVKLNLILNDAFFAGESINPFAGASLQLTFNVPNPGYDVALGVSTNTQPLLKDQYGHVWVAKKEIAVSFVKKQTRRTYRIDDVRVVRKNSVSEEATVLKGSIADDPLCNSGKLACCPSDEGHYTQYSLVQSPVPPYHCTEDPVVFIDGSFSFQYEGRVTFGDESASTSCDVLSTVENDSKECNDGSVIVDVKRLPLTYVFPVSALSLCRPGENLTDTTYTSQPFFATLCETARCIGYTSENYKVDGGTCQKWPLGYYTSRDVNNTSQFSYYENFFPFFYMSPDCVWMNDAFMGPGNMLKELTLRCNMQPSTDWSVSHRFPSTAPLVQFIRPTFLYGRATRTEASRTVTDGVAVTVEFVSFSPANGTWTMTACYEKGDVCKSVHFTVRGNNDWKPMQINVELPSAVNTNSEASVAVLVQVESLATPVRSPFRFLLEKRRLIIQPAKPSAAAHSRHVNLDLARQPYERIPPPQNTNGRMMQCVDDFTFSASTGGCVPFADDECTRKYKGRRNKFDPKKKSCGVTLPLRTEKIRAVPIPLPQAPKKKKFDRAEQRKFLEELKLPKWMKPMKQLLQEYDEMQKSGKKTVPKKPQPPAEPQKASQTATMVVNVFFVLGTVGNIILICVRDRLLNFFVRRYRRSSSSPSATPSRNWSFVFEIVPARISTYFSSSIPAQMQGRETTVPVDGAGPNAGSQTPPRRSFLTQQQQQVVAQYQQKQQQQAMMMQLQQQLLLQQQQQAQAQSPLYPYPNVGLVAPSPQQQQEQQMHQYVIPGYPNEPYFHGEPTQR